jgi:type III secretion protein K
VAAIEQMPARENLWHRHWSRHILRHLDLQDRWATDLADPLLALALLSPRALARHARKLGVVLCRPRLQHMISGSEVRTLQTALGPGLFPWIYAHMPHLHAGIAGPPFRRAEEAMAEIDGVGEAVLHASFSLADVAIVGRVRLKLPVIGSSTSAGVKSPLPCPVAASEARALALKLLDH